MNRPIVCRCFYVTLWSFLLIVSKALAEEPIEKIQEQLALKAAIKLERKASERAQELGQFLNSIPTGQPKINQVVPLADLKPELQKFLLEREIQAIGGAEPPAPQVVAAPFRSLKVIPLNDGDFKVQIEGVREDLATAWECGSECVKIGTAGVPLEIPLGGAGDMLYVAFPNRPRQWEAMALGIFLGVVAVALLSLVWWYLLRRKQKTQGDTKKLSKNGEPGGVPAPGKPVPPTPGTPKKDGKPGASEDSAQDDLANRLLRHMETTFSMKLEPIAQVLNGMNGQQSATKKEILEQLARQTEALKQKNAAEMRLSKLEGNLCKGPSQLEQRIQLLLDHEKLAGEMRQRLLVYEPNVKLGDEAKAIDRLVQNLHDHETVLAERESELQSVNAKWEDLVANKRSSDSELKAARDSQAALIRRLHLPTPVEGRDAPRTTYDGARWDLRLAWASAVSILDSISEDSPPNQRSAKVVALLFADQDWPGFVSEVRRIASSVLESIGEPGTDQELTRILFKDKSDVDTILRAELLFRTYGRAEGKPTEMGMVLGMMAQSVRIFATSVGVAFAEFELLQPLPRSVAMLNPSIDTRDRQYTELVNDDPELTRRLKVGLELPPDILVLLDVIEHPYWMADGRSVKGQIVAMTPGEWVQGLAEQAER